MRSSVAEGLMAVGWMMTEESIGSWSGFSVNHTALGEDEDGQLAVVTIFEGGGGGGGQHQHVNGNDPEEVPAGYGFLETVLISGVLLIIIVGTIVGNILVCTAVCLVRRLRRPCNYLLVSLAVSDLCVALLVMPMALVYEVLGAWPFGTTVCDAWVAFDVLSCTASILNLCMISVDRYWAITRPLDYGVKRTPVRMCCCVALVWISSACISLPPLLVLGNEHGTEEDRQCQVCQEFGYQIYATLGSFYIPLAVMAAVYYQIFQAAKRIVDEEKKAQSHLLLTSRAAAGSSSVNPPASGNAVPVATEMAVRLDLQPGNSGGGSSSVVCHQGQNGRPVWPDVCSSAATSSSVRGRPSLDIPRSPRRRYSSATSTEIHDTSLSLNSITAQQQQTLLCHHHGNHRQHSSSVSGSQGGGGGPSGRSLTANHHSRVRLRFALNKERKASTTLGIIMSAFTLCWFPFFVLALARPFVSQPDEAIPRWLSSLFLWLGYANSFLNPVIYATTNKDFRLPFKEILCLRCKSLNSVMREDFYQSQYGGEGPRGPVMMTAAAVQEEDEEGGGGDCDCDHHRLQHCATEIAGGTVVMQAMEDGAGTARAGSATAFL